MSVYLRCAAESCFDRALEIREEVIKSLQEEASQYGELNEVDASIEAARLAYQGSEKFEKALRSEYANDPKLSNMIEVLVDVHATYFISDFLDEGLLERILQQKH